ncbi:MAG TPA: hypothetical protein VGO67_06250 [Verrucomicrobiae bacterium]|jgi:hypothetical protein
MSEAAKSVSVWTNGRFIMVVAALFALQVGLIALFGARTTEPTAAPVPVTRFRATRAEMSQQQLMYMFFVSDPTVFPLPGKHGFSGRAWMNQPPEQYQSSNLLESPILLALDTSKLGAGSNFLNDTKTAAPLAIAQMQYPQVEALPVFLSPQIMPTQTVFRIEGELKNRLIGPLPPLRAWPSSGTKLLTKTVVQIAVNQTGDILTARLQSRSGSPDADADAVAKAWALRFRPSTDPTVQWAEAVFQWQTTFSSATGVQP